MNPAIARLAIFGLFFVSGALGLVYEVLWTRILAIAFGQTVWAAATVLAAFMGGLALGSYLFGRFSDRVIRPARVYGWLEIGIGVFAVVAYPAFFRLELVYGPFYGRLLDSPWLLILVRFAIAFLMLLIPTTLMGATVPILVRAIGDRSNSLGLRVATLYSLNTAGAVLGTLLCGFVLIPGLGLSTTNWLAVGLNVLLGLLAMSLPAGSPAVSEPVAPESKAGSGAVLWAAALAGMVAIGMEVLWTRSLIFALFLGSTTFAFTTMLAAFLFGISSGAAVMARFVDRIRHLAWAFLAVEFGVGLASLFALRWVLSGAMRPADTADFTRGALFDFLKLTLLMFASTACMGAAFPILAKLAIAGRAGWSRQVARVYAANTVGGIVGALATGFLLIPWVGISWSVTILAATCLLVGWLPALVASENRLRRLPLAATAVAAAVIFGFGPRGDFRRMFEAQGARICFYEEGAAGTVTATDWPNGWKSLYVDSISVQEAANMGALTVMKRLAHLPSLLHPNPKSAFTIGYGTGGTAYAFTLHRSYERIVAAEIEPGVARAADCFPESNHGMRPGKDPRLSLVVDDARAYLENSRESFDVITVDLTDPAFRSNADLYTKDFLELCRSRLSDGGIITVRMILRALSTRNLRILLHTMIAAFGEENLTIWHESNYPNPDLTLIARRGGPLTIDVAELSRRMAAPGLREDLAEINFVDATEILGSYMLPARALRDFVADLPVHTVDHPILEFETPKDRFLPDTATRNLWDLFWQSPGFLPALTAPPSPELQLALRRKWAAREAFLSGEREVLRAREMIVGRAGFLRALRIRPEDPSYRYCLEATEAQLAALDVEAATGSEDAMARRILAHLVDADAAWLRSAVTELAGRYPDHPFLPYAQGRLAQLDENWDLAEHSYRTFLPLASPQMQVEVNARLEVVRLRREANPAKGAEVVRAMIAAGDVEPALDLARALVADVPGQRWARLWLAQVLKSAGHLAAALAELESLLAEMPSDPELLLQTAEIHQLLRELEPAEALLNRVLEIDSGRAVAIYNLARIARLRDDDVAAKRRLEQAAALDPNSTRQAMSTDPVFGGGV